MGLLPKLDKKKTRENARNVLREYPRLQRLLVAKPFDSYNMLQGIQYSDMPTTRNNRNNQEIKTIKSISSEKKINTSKLEEELACIEKALNALSNVYREILKYSYCKSIKYSTNKIAFTVKFYRVNSYGDSEEYHQTPKNIERLRALALIEFAEAYRGGKLLAYKDSEKN